MVKSALFVCLGNICRSPIAEGVFLNIIKSRGIDKDWEVDSAAIGSWHTGKSPDRRARSVLDKYGIEYNNKARQIKQSDFEKFDYIFGMDRENISDLNELKKSDAKAKVLLLGDFDPQGDKIIRDPYYDDGSEGFEKCYQQCLRACNGFLDSLK